MQFTQLKLTGFKSFVEPTNLVILPGATGIVGPNGCGKSNLVEALRWVMGESSAKQMRGGEMDDVIFGGTSDRPARNLAEVGLVLDNSERDAPAAHNDTDNLEVVRRIERGSGSQYRVNGKDIRARDVQLLFADAATGARSTAMVGQGQIGAIINAKPTDRRHLLEEAAGITGLHGRRHEAELRLRAAETNLERLDDVVQALQAQLQGLKRQARQAARYRSLSGRIRRAEAMLYYSRWREAETAVAEARIAVEGEAGHVAEKTQIAARAATQQADRAEALPPLRAAEARAAAGLHRLAVERDRLAEEEQRVAETLRSLSDQLEQLDADLKREAENGLEAREAVQSLDKESEALREAGANAEALIGDAVQSTRAAMSAAEQREQEVARLTEDVAGKEAERAALIQRVSELRGRLDRLSAEDAKLAQQQQHLADTSAGDKALTDADAAIQQAFGVLETLKGDLAEAEKNQSVLEARQDEADAHDRTMANRLREAVGAVDRLRTEIATLEESVHGAESAKADDHKRIIDQVTVDDGFEMALEAALGDDLFAATETGHASAWSALDYVGEAPALPDNVPTLQTVVSGPSALTRRLSQVGLIEGSDGPRLQARLRQGQRLVSRDGALWRWDGFQRNADAPGGAAIRLRQRNRLGELQKRFPDAELTVQKTKEAASAATANHEAAKAARSESQDIVAALRTRVDEADKALTAARDQRSAAERAGHEERSRRAALAEAAERVRSDLADVRGSIQAAAAAVQALASPEAVRAPLDTGREALAEARAALQACQAAEARCVAEAAARQERLSIIGAERARWLKRADEADTHGQDLKGRHKDITDRRAELAKEPDRLATLRENLGERIAAAETERTTAADALATAETALAASDKALAEANAALAETREEKVRVDGRLDQAVSVRDLEAEQIRERLNCEPPQALDLAEVKSEDDLPDLSHIDRQLERLFRERESMGAVNLRADEEAAELTQQIETLEGEREDLLGAIARLRSGIGSLNREGRQRLLDAFNRVNSHFEELFVRLFGGGRAHLSLIGSDDPLEAGLEVMASPPGKKLQSLSLLSGGEKALAGLSLLFAVFLTKPAPICVLDEVDAPLDDANVDRFCNLLEEIARTSGTRFLVVTHHRLTMARMDRLYGVTMTERGVSRLVSVDLGQGPQLQAAE